MVTVPSPAGSDPARYEKVIQGGLASPGDLAGRFAAAGVAGPAPTAFSFWLLEESKARGLWRLRFLSRNGQVLSARRLAAGAGAGLDLEYVYSSRLTWSLAVTDHNRLAEAL
jgi:hypothetical protein